MTEKKNPRPEKKAERHASLFFLLLLFKHIPYQSLVLPVAACLYLTSFFPPQRSRRPLHPLLPHFQMGVSWGAAPVPDLGGTFIKRQTDQLHHETVWLIASG